MGNKLVKVALEFTLCRYFDAVCVATRILKYCVYDAYLADIWKQVSISVCASVTTFGCCVSDNVFDPVCEKFGEEFQKFKSLTWYIVKFLWEYAPTLALGTLVLHGVTCVNGRISAETGVYRLNTTQKLVFGCRQSSPSTKSICIVCSGIENNR
jgi:hypothetical protein